MRSKFLAGTAALALAGTAILATAGPVSADDWRVHRSFGAGLAGLAAGVVGGAVAAATAPLWAPGYYGYYPDYAYAPDYVYAPGYAYGGAYSYEPGYAYVPGNTYGQRDDGYCAQRYRSYDPASGTYLGYDGIRHPCP